MSLVRIILRIGGIATFGTDSKHEYFETIQHKVDSSFMWGMLSIKHEYFQKIQHKVATRQEPSG